MNAKYKVGQRFISTKTGNPIEVEVTQVTRTLNATTGETMDIKYVAEFLFAGQVTIPIEFTEKEIEAGLQDARI